MLILPAAKTARGDAQLSRTLSSKPVALMALAVAALFFSHAPARAAAVWPLGSSMDNVRPLSIGLSTLLASVPADRLTSEPKAKAAHALELLSQNKLEEGSVQMNSALKLDPSNSYLQFFNAFTYHLMAQQGDSQKLGLAEQGYMLAIQFDRSNWIAHYFLGLLYFEQHNFRSAQRELAEVLLFHEDDQEVLFRLVAASYYSGDPVTAAACLDRLRILSPSDPQILRLSAIINAAIGRSDEAKRWLSLYQATNPAADELSRVKERVSHWAVVHRDAPVDGAKSSLLSDSGTIIPAPARTTNGLSLQMAAPRMIRTQMPTIGEMTGGAPPAPAGMSGAPAPMQVPPNPDAGLQSRNGQRMVLVDVVIMRTEDSLSTHKGLNLLSALTLQFGNAAAPGFSKTFSATRAADGTLSASTTLTRAINIPALTYSLNMVNSNTDLDEVLARPTLVALEGVKSEFFSGETLNAAVVSTGANSGGAVQIEKEIGVKLSIVPTFLSDNRIKLSVDAQRTFLKPPSADVGFTYKVEVTKVMVNANVVMDFGETLVLGGLSEKETTSVRDGVPFLQDIPGIQYLFSSKDTSNFQRSVLMLITPRAPQYTYRSEESIRAEAGSSGDSESLKELRARYGDWFKPYPTLESVFHHLNVSSIYREFRTGDVTLEKWDKQDAVLDRLKQALGFLFY